MLDIFKKKKKYGVTRRDVYSLHVMFSEYMVNKIQFMYDYVEDMQHIPSKLSEQGDEIGTMTVLEWKCILGEILFALRYDIYGNDEEMPEDLSAVGEYLTDSYEKEFRYKQGLRLFGVYYSHLWG